jgi:hypothetical protein
MHCSAGTEQKKCAPHNCQLIMKCLSCASFYRQPPCDALSWGVLRCLYCRCAHEVSYLRPYLLVYFETSLCSSFLSFYLLTCLCVAGLILMEFAQNCLQAARREENLNKCSGLQATIDSVFVACVVSCHEAVVNVILRSFVHFAVCSQYRLRTKRINIVRIIDEHVFFGLVA